MTPADAAALDDASLDTAYAAAFDSNDVSTASLLENEIITRLQSVGSFLEGIVGYSRFPLYSARGHFNQTGAAQSSVATAAANVGTAAVNGVGAVVGGITSAFLPVLLIGVAVAWFYFTKVKK